MGTNDPSDDDDDAPAARRTVKMATYELERALEAMRATGAAPAEPAAPDATSAESEGQQDTLRPATSIAAVDDAWPTDEPDV